MTGSFAALCAILALLATPSGVFADDAEACRNCCEAQHPDTLSQEYMACWIACMEGNGT